MYSTFRNIQPKKHPGVWCEVIDMHQLHSYEISGTPFQMKTAVWWAWRNNTIDIRQWRHVVLMDKYRFLVDGRRQVRPLWDEYFRDNCIKSTVSVWGESVVIWGGIYYNGNSGRTDVRNHTPPSLSPCFGNLFIIQDDNIRPHRPRSITRYLDYPGLNTIDYISALSSQDVNNCIDSMVHRVVALIEAYGWANCFCCIV